MMYKTNCECGEIVEIDSEKLPYFFSEHDQEKKISFLEATCLKCFGSIIINRPDIGNTVKPSGPASPKKSPVRWVWKCEE